MQVERLRDPDDFLDAADPLLRSDEARHNLLYGLVDTLRRRPALYPAWDLWVVRDGGDVVGAALQTPPYNLVLARPAIDGVLDALVEAVIDDGVRPPGVSGTRPEVERFAERWTQRAGGRWDVRMAQGVYVLRTVRRAPAAPGAPRLATPADEAVIRLLVEAFVAEAVLEVIRDPESARRTVAARMGDDAARGGFWLWEDGGQVVSISGHGMPTPTGIRIGPVFTPPEHRRRGYATSLVERQAAWLLAQGWASCFLYTDLGNPTSNAVYRRVGYEQVAEALDIGFATDADQPQSGGAGA
jgi:GNAT superfamily N-acetyltransferase